VVASEVNYYLLVFSCSNCFASNNYLLLAKQKFIFFLYSLLLL
jgi:hypothetical protein